MQDDAIKIKSLVDSLEASKIAAALRELDENQMQPLHIAAYNGAGKAIASLASLDRGLLEEVSSRGQCCLSVE